MLIAPRRSRTRRRLARRGRRGRRVGRVGRVGGNGGNGGNGAGGVGGFPGNGSHRRPPLTTKPHDALVSENMRRKLAGNDRRTSTTSSSQKHERALSDAMASQHVSVSAPAHPSWTSRISVPVGHVSPAPSSRVSSSSASAPSSPVTDRHARPTRVSTPHLRGAVASAGTSAPCRVASNPRNGSEQKHRASSSSRSSSQHAAVVFGPVWTVSGAAFAHSVGNPSRRASVQTAGTARAPRADAQIDATSARVVARRRMRSRAVTDAAPRNTRETSLGECRGRKLRWISRRSLCSGSTSSVNRARMTGDWRVLKAAGKSREKRIAFDAGNFGGS